MKRIVAMAAAVVVGMSVLASGVQASDSQPGGVQGFFAGCCFGLRTGTDYNDNGTGDRNYLPWFLVGVCLGPRTAQEYAAGKDFHWREIGRAIPYVNIIFMIWDGIDISGGKSRADIQQAYGSNYY